MGIAREDAGRILIAALKAASAPAPKPRPQGRVGFFLARASPPRVLCLRPPSPRAPGPRARALARRHRRCCVWPPTHPRRIVCD